jgi:hypothetical protein
MKISGLKPIIASLPSAIVASLCCVLPLTVVLLGMGSGAFMMTTMKYSYVFIPAGVIGVGLGYFLYFREKKKNHACRKVEPHNSDIRNNRGRRISCFQCISWIHRSAI